MEAWKHIRAILVLPVMAAVVIPGLLLYFTGADSFGLGNLLRLVVAILGVLHIIVGLTLMVATIRLFVTVGNGTLAPWEPPQHFVVQGIYRHVRNPMISGVLAILLGESLVAVSLPLFGWFVFFLVGNMIWMPLVEEPGLVKRFGEEYEEYRRNVPRWVPRVRGWRP